MSTAAINQTMNKLPTLDNIVFSDDDTVDQNSSSNKDTANNGRDKSSAKENATELKNGEEKKDDDEKVEDLKREKRARNIKPFDEDLLISAPGLQRVHEEFPLLCKFRGRGSEAQDLQRLMSMYREWAFQLHPGLSFPDVLSRMETLGSRAKIRTWLDNARETERYRYITHNLGVSLPRSMHKQSNKSDGDGQPAKRQRNDESSAIDEAEDEHEHARHYDDVDDDDDGFDQMVTASNRPPSDAAAAADSVDEDALAAEIAAAAAMDFSEIGADIGDHSGSAVADASNVMRLEQESALTNISSADLEAGGEINGNSEPVPAANTAEIAAEGNKPTPSPTETSPYAEEQPAAESHTTPQMLQSTTADDDAAAAAADSALARAELIASSGDDHTSAAADPATADGSQRVAVDQSPEAGNLTSPEAM